MSIVSTEPKVSNSSMFGKNTFINQYFFLVLDIFGNCNKSIRIIIKRVTDKRMVLNKEYNSREKSLLKKYLPTKNVRNNSLTNLK